MKKHCIFIFGFGVLVVWVAYGIIIITHVFGGDVQKSGQFGDTFGALNTLFAGLAFVVLLATLKQQSHQIEETKQDVADERRFRLKLDLFDRRYLVYQATIDFIGNVIGNLKNESIDQSQMARFDSARSEAFFLFSGETDLLNYLEEVRKKSKDLAIWRSQPHGQGVGSEAATQRKKLTDWFFEELHGGARDKFVPHLALKRIDN
jgi:hypothetical protein